MHRLCDRAHQVVRVVVQRGDADGGEIGAGLLQRVAAQRRMTGGDAREEGLAGGLARSAATRASTRAFNSREARVVKNITAFTSGRRAISILTESVEGGPLTGCWDQSTLAPEARISGASRACCMARWAAISSGVVHQGSAPRSR